MSNVTYRTENGIAHVRLDRPDKLNALTLPILQDLATTAHTLRSDKDLRAVVISGEGDAFCAGLDFASVMKSPAGIAKAFVPLPWRGTNLFQEACWAWRRVPVPVIAAVHGHCLGGGLQIALAADFRIATPDSRWSVLEGKWGLIPDMSGIRSLLRAGRHRPGQAADDDRRDLRRQPRSGARARHQARQRPARRRPTPRGRALGQVPGRPGRREATLQRQLPRRRPRRTFARERLEQAFLLAARNTKAAREAAFKKSDPAYGPRGR